MRAPWAEQDFGPVREAMFRLETHQGSRPESCDTCGTDIKPGEQLIDIRIAELLLCLPCAGEISRHWKAASA